jgi:chaperonin GroES
MAIRTLWNRIWVKPQAKEQKTASGLIMPTANDDKICYGVVEDSPIDEIKKGDTIIYQKGKGIDALYEGESYIILQKDDILAIVD